MNQSIEKTALSNLISNENYARKVIPFIKSDYFDVREERIVFEEILKFVDKYNKIPTKTSLGIEVENRKDLTETDHKKIVELIQTLDASDVDFDWLVDTTEKFCKDKAIYNAIVDGIKIIDGKDDKRNPDAIPEILTEALGVSFDNSVGHDYLGDSENRFDYYHRVEEKIPFDLGFFNKVTKGGLPPKTLNIALAGTGVGKSLFMCHVAANCLSQGKNVLYITLEMAEERIAERIDANLMNVSMEDLHDLPKKMFQDKISRITKKTSGKLIVKEYPTASAHSGHFRGEELRGLAVETNVPFMSATQTTRTGFVSSDIGLEDTSESFGLPATADFMFALISTEELEDLNQICIKQLKNRYNDPTINKRFVIGVDRAKMKLYDVELKAQEEIVDNGQEIEPTFEKTTFGNKTKAEKYEKFSKLKV